MKLIQYLFLTIPLALSLMSCKVTSGWQSLSNVSTLEEFDVLNGTAEYHLEDGVIVGISKVGTPNTFLCTKRHYSDFILEFEVWADPLLNSGVQIRSNSLPDYQEGRVHGYQVEIESSDRRWSGGIYDEGRRGWLYPLVNNPTGQQAFVKNSWNHYRIEAIGPEINTWVNGIQCARLVDDMTSSGFIGFQVHSIGDPELAGKEIKWRNIRIQTYGLERAKTPSDPEVPVINLIQPEIKK